MDKAGFNSILSFIYGKETAEKILPELLAIIDSNKPQSETKHNSKHSLPFTHKDAFLITYGNMLSADTGSTSSETGLARLFRFLEKRNKGSFSYLHILPFHPYSSDDGFSVIDYRQIDDRFGSWDDIEHFKALDTNNGKLKLAFDFVVNHGSVQSEWFRGFLQNENAYNAWYVTRPSDYDYKTVVRPRTHPLLTEFKKANGEPVWVWTTFSADQVDYDFSNPIVLLEFVKILLEYARRGAGIVRLDAIAYLWKEDGTPCLHHPKTHAVVKLFRGIVDCLGLPLLILTETNVPHEENISYFGKTVGDAGFDTLPEAHMVYNFALPPLALYAAISGDAGPLRKWAGTLSLEPGKYFLNFLASHDGVGLTPARGLVDEKAFKDALEEAKRRGALISYKSTPQGDIPYELNCSYASIVAPPGLGTAELRARAFCAVNGILLSLPGLPAMYFHSWIGSEAWAEGPELLGYNRAINREKPAIDTVEKALDDPETFRYHVHQRLNAFLAFRQKYPVFNPDVPCYVLETGEGRSLFALIRGPSKEGSWALCIENIGGSKTKFIAEAGIKPNIAIPTAYKQIEVEPWETRWVMWDKNGTADILSSV
ncbi:MAG: alpha-amylase family glycosyl hydrolase [Treponema sp.]|nr:alpha-amylase family glycosyl hydrolase [Treponema sp.]